jgi:hypothetical protein
LAGGIVKEDRKWIFPTVDIEYGEGPVAIKKLSFTI